MLQPLLFTWFHARFGYPFQLFDWAEVMLFAQTGLGVEIFSPLGILILVIGVTFTVGLPVAMIKYGKKN